MFYKLDSLRGLAAIMVIMFHSPFNYAQEKLNFFSNSLLFVDFFFILSGFVMSFAYGAKISQGLHFRKYITLRLGRIYPLHLLMLFTWVPYILFKEYLYISGYGGRDQFIDSNLYSFVSNLLLLQSMGIHSHLSWNYISWSISVEFFAYIVFYLFIVSIDKHRTLIVPILVSTLSYLFLYTLDRGGNFDITYDYGFIRCIGAFYLGVFLFRLHLKSNQDFSKISINLLEFSSISLLLLSVTFANLNYLTILLVMLNFLFILFVFSRKESGLLGDLIQIKPFLNIGIWSYSIYMVHGLIVAGTSNLFEFILKYDLHAGLGFTAMFINIFIIIITIFISKYTYTYIEKKYRDLIRAKATY